MALHMAKQRKSTIGASRGNELSFDCNRSLVHSMRRSLDVSHIQKMGEEELPEAAARRTMVNLWKRSMSMTPTCARTAAYKSGL